MLLLVAGIWMYSTAFWNTTKMLLLCFYWWLESEFWAKFSPDCFTWLFHLIVSVNIINQTCNNIWLSVQMLSSEMYWCWQHPVFASSCSLVSGSVMNLATVNRYNVSIFLPSTENRIIFCSEYYLASDHKLFCSF